MSKKLHITPSLQDYLEAIFHIVARKQAARAKDIADRMQVNSSSVTGALRALAQKGLVNYSPYDIVTLTPQGYKLGAQVVRRHEVLRDFFTGVLGVNDREAEEAACKMEHGMTPAILERFIAFAEFTEVCPLWRQHLVTQAPCHFEPMSGPDGEKECADCIALCLQTMRRSGKAPATSPVTVNELDIGDRARIISIAGHGAAERKMAEAGAGPGTPIQVEDVSSDDGTIGLRVRGYHINVQPEEAEEITVQKL